MTDSIHIFGVRHLSPMGAMQLRHFLDEIKPKVVLIEGLADATHLVSDIVRKDTKPPIAILAYSTEPPVETLMYPMAEYSPEYEALMWSKSNRARARFIDLPSDVFLSLGRATHQRATRLAEGTDDDEKTVEECPLLDRGLLYQQFAKQFNEPDYDTYWERHFEHNASRNAYRLAAIELGKGLREFDADTDFDRAENLVREAYMRKCIQEEIESGTSPDKIVAVVGAFHAPVLGPENLPMTDSEFESLPRIDSHLTLMPYSYFKLSSQSGYGAGNKAPAYFQMVWESLQEEESDDIAARYLSGIVRHLRSIGDPKSTASVIEGVRLAKTLSALKDGLAPTLADLHDATVTLIGEGERSVVEEAIARQDVGTAVGKLPKGVSQTSIQADFDRELKRLKLTKYRESTAKQELTLDLRENRQVKSEEAAYIDLHRSCFLHRLKVLGICFAEKIGAKQDSANWRENWALQWTPESEIELVESVLLGETIALATAFTFKTRLDATKEIEAAARTVREACECGLMESMEQARRAVQRLSSESSNFTALAEATIEIAMVARYGDVRNFDSKPLLPLLEELFVQGVLSLIPSANCDSEAAKKMVGGIDRLNRVSQDWYEQVEEGLWERELLKLSSADDLNPLLSGFACAILLERNLISNDELAREVSRRLSPGIDADLGAGWFEGLAKRNRYALLSRLALWEQLAEYVASLDDEQFTRALVFLRRSFGGFSPQEKRAIAENLGEIWGIGAEATSEVLSTELTESEEKQIDELDDFDFDDL